MSRSLRNFLLSKPGVWKNGAWELDTQAKITVTWHSPADNCDKSATYSVETVWPKAFMPGNKPFRAITTWEEVK